MNTNMNYKNKNIYSVLNINDDEYEFTFPEKITHLEMHPVAKLIKYKNITHLEPHPTTHLIKFSINIKYFYGLSSERHVKVTFLDRLQIPQNYKFKNLNEQILGRTDESYMGQYMPKLLKCEIDILKNKMDKAFDKYADYEKHVRTFYKSINDEYEEKYKDKFNYEDFYGYEIGWKYEILDKYKELYEDFETKYNYALKKREGTLKEYLESIYDSDW